MVVAALVGPWLASFSLRWTAWATVVPYAAAWVLAWFLKDPGTIRPRPLIGSRERRKLILALGRLFSKGAGWPLGLAVLALTAEVSHLAVVFLSQLQYQRACIPTSAFGVLFLTLQLVPMAVLALAPPRFGRRPPRWLIGLTLAMAILLGILAVQANPVVTVAAMVLLAVVGQAQGPLVAAWQNQQLRGGSRATTLSVHALWSEAVAAGANGVLGSLPAEVDVLLLVAAGLALVSAFTLFVVEWEHARSLARLGRPHRPRPPGLL